MLNSNPNYLRVSVTDYCNLNCIYCQSQEQVKHLERKDLLSFEEIVEFVRLATRFGIEKVRITGGEPLMRKDVIVLLKMLRQIPDLKLYLTTNGVRLLEFACALNEIGIDGMNVSLDTLNPGKFVSIVGKNELGNVLDGIIAVRDLGIHVKINTVVLKGINDDEIIEFLRFAKNNSLILRFIEYMAQGRNHNEEWFLSNTEVRNKIEDYIGPLQPYYFNSRCSGPAKYYKNSGLVIGFISSRSESFCLTCNRIRLTPDGRLRPCLFLNSEYDIRDLMREGYIEKVQETFLIACKNKKYICSRPKENYIPVSMVRIGG